MVLDAVDRIISVSGGWDSVAADGGGRCFSDTIIGTKLSDHIAGTAMQRAMGILLATARRVGSSIRFPYRCDTPEERRWMELSVTPGENGELVLEHHLVSSEKRRPGPASASILSGKPVGTERIPVLHCSTCNCYDLRDGNGWQEASVPIGDQWLKVIHTVCADCRDRLRNIRQGIVNQTSGL